MWININRNGRLGNRLFSRAHVLAAAIELGEQVLDWGLGDIAKHYPNVENEGLPYYPLERPAGYQGQDPKTSAWNNERLLHTLRMARPRSTGQRGPVWSCYWSKDVSPEEMRLDGEAFQAFNKSRDLIFLDGYKLRCTPWLVKHADAVRDYFKPRAALCDKWEKITAHYRQSYDQIIAIHMRSTDFKKAQGGCYYLSPKEYADLLRDRVDAGAGRIVCFLFSDEAFRDSADYAQMQQDFKDHDFVFFHGSEIDDMVGMSYCDRILGPASSTFSRWAGFAGQTEWLGVSRQVLEETGPLEFTQTPVPWDY